MLVMLVMIATLTKCTYDWAMEPSVAKAQLLQEFPEINCQRAELDTSDNNEAFFNVEVLGDKECMQSLRAALVKRQYQRGNRFGEWQLRDGYRSTNETGPVMMFSFYPDGRTAKWIKED